MKTMEDLSGDKIELKKSVLGGQLVLWICVAGHTVAVITKATAHELCHALLDWDGEAET